MRVTKCAGHCGGPSGNGPGGRGSVSAPVTIGTGRSFCTGRHHHQSRTGCAQCAVGSKCAVCSLRAIGTLGTRLSGGPISSFGPGCGSGSRRSLGAVFSLSAASTFGTCGRTASFGAVSA